MSILDILAGRFDDIQTDAMAQIQDAVDGHNRALPGAIAMFAAAPRNAAGAVVCRMRCVCGAMIDNGPEPRGECVVMSLDAYWASCATCRAKADAKWDGIAQRYRHRWTGQFVRDPWEDDPESV